MRRVLGFFAVCACLAATPLRACADDFDPPAGYYTSAVGTGATLKANLNSIIDGHTSIGYSSLPVPLGVTDDDPNPAKPNNLLTVYDRTSINKQYSNDPLIWNREHTWPRSRGISNTGPDDSDLFNIRPALTEGNGDRQNFNFGGAYNSQGPGLVTAPNPDQWYPGNADAGMIARQQFYMAVRYDGVDAGTTDLELVSGNPASGGSTLGDLDRLIEWHFAAPPDEFERRRNQIIYDQYQHNRNPFTDRPELAWSVFIDQANDSGLTLAGGTVGLGDATTLAVDLGRRLIGGPAPGTYDVTINKAGVDGTYYQVTTADAATSAVNGRFNAFTMGTTGSRTFAVGLSPALASTATVGLKSGTVTIDNLDVTTGGGANRGANDDDDVVTVSMSVLNHANASFALGADVNSILIDFGAVLQGASAPSLPFSLFNLPTIANFTAGLDLDGILGANDTSVLTTTLSTFSGGSTLAEGLSRSFTAMMDTSTIGSFTASYALSFSDENLPGATAVGGLTLTLAGIVEGPTTPNADFDDSGLVDGADLLAWQRGFGLSTGALASDGDANGDQAVDDTDLAVWRDQLGGPGPTIVAMPEPTGLSVAVCGVLAYSLMGARRRFRRLAG